MALSIKSTNSALLKHANGSLMLSPCCCGRCQWAVDFVFYCVGGCGLTSHAWEEGVPPENVHMTYHEWLAPSNPGDPAITFTVGLFRWTGSDTAPVFWVCIEEHDVNNGDAFDSSKWSGKSLWMQDGDPYCETYAIGVDVNLPGLYYDEGNNCAATRYGPIHQKTSCGSGDCTSADVSTALPSDYDYSDLCGVRPYLTYHDWYDCGSCLPPRVCSVSVTISGIPEGNMFYDCNGTWDFWHSCRFIDPWGDPSDDHNANMFEGCFWGAHVDPEGANIIHMGLTGGMFGPWSLLIRQMRPWPYSTYEWQMAWYPFSGELCDQSGTESSASWSNTGNYVGSITISTP